MGTAGPREFDLDLELFPDAPAGFLTLAERQLFEVAKALATDPKVLLLDEPTTALGPNEVEALHRTVAACRERGVGVVYVSHRLPEVLEIADRITVLRDGRIRGSFDASATNESALVELIVGRPFETAFPPPAARPVEAREVLVVDGLQGQSFGPLSFTLGSGEIVGIAGAEGNGQPQLFDCLAGRQPPRAGRVVCDGKELMPISTHEAVRSGIMLLPGDRTHEALMPMLGVRVNTTVQTLRRFSVLGFLRRRPERRKVQGLVEQFGIRTPSLEQPVEFLSGGNQQKVAVSRLFLREPSVILAYEPTQGVDVGPIRHLRGPARPIRRRHRVAGQIERPAELAGLCDRVPVMSRGQIIEEIPGDELDELRIVEAIVRGLGYPGPGARRWAWPCPGARLLRARRDRTHAHRLGQALGPQVLRDARDRNKWRKIVRFRLWMPVVLQLILIGLVIWYTESRFPGFMNERNVTNVLFLAVPLAVVAMGQTNALLVGHPRPLRRCDGHASAWRSHPSRSAPSPRPPRSCSGSASSSSSGVSAGLANGGLVLEFTIPSIIATLATLSVLTDLLTLRESPGGSIDRTFTSGSKPRSAPSPSPSSASRSPPSRSTTGCMRAARPAAALGRVRRAIGQAQRRPYHMGEDEGDGAVGVVRGVGAVLRHGAVRIGNAQIGESYALSSLTAAVLGGAALAGGRATFIGASVASVLLALILTASPSSV